jgi:sugar phosphate permease
MLALGVAAQAAGTFLVSTPAYLIPFLHMQQGMPLAEAGLLAAAPTFGMVLTLVAWGALADRFGERWVIAGGLALTALFAPVAVPAAGWGYAALGILLLLGGGASASVNAASGRVVVGWFPRSRRGLAMGIRQMSQPLGVAVAALVVPPLALQHGIGAPLAAAAVALAVLAVACAVGIADPPRPAKPGSPNAENTPTSTPTSTSSSANAPAGPTASAPAPAPTSTSTGTSTSPYRRSPFLLRIHLASALLVVPQFTLSTFGLVWLITALHWNPAAAGAVIALSQFVGAFGRIAVGHLSDRVDSRTRVMRWVAVSGVAAMLLLATMGLLEWSAAAAVMLVIATTVSVADNGLAFTAVAEAAGPHWSGRALGVQNTGQFVAASVVGPAIGALITVAGYPLAFALVALTPLASLALIPRHDEHPHEP